MKVIILAGGYGTRISEESQYKPKPMIEIGNKPILWHIMNEYSFYGMTEFIICAGYKQHVIKEYFYNYSLYNSDVTFDFRDKKGFTVENNHSESWKVTVVDTGYETNTGKRLKIVQPFVGNETFMLTYGDGLSDVNIKKLLDFHKAQGKYLTITATKPESRFGFLELEGNMVKSFREKSQEDVGYINSGYMVMEPQVFDYLKGNVMLERSPMENLAADGQIVAYRHNGFWQCMDTMRDKQKLEELWADGNAPWKVW